MAAACGGGAAWRHWACHWEPVAFMLSIPIALHLPERKFHFGAIQERRLEFELQGGT
jgi:hypothetical protein